MIVPLITAVPGLAAATFLGVALMAVAWASVHYRRIDATERLTSKALDGASPAERARILRAAGEFGSKLHPGTPPGGTPGRKLGGDVGRRLVPGRSRRQD